MSTPPLGRVLLLAAVAVCVGHAPAVQTPMLNAAPAPSWVARGGFQLKALDKVDARSKALSGRVGETVSYGSLSILVRSCMVRSPDQIADSTAFLEITDAHPAAPGFRGWMFSGEPSLAMLESPIYDIRLVGCSA